MNKFKNNESEETQKETKLQKYERWSYLVSFAIGMTINDKIQGGILGAAIICGSMAVIPWLAFLLIEKFKK